MVQDVVAYLSGEGMSSRWHVVASRKLAGKNMGKTPVYQWYLSIYAPAQNDVAKLVYRSPGPGNSLLAKIAKANGAELYFPTQQLTIVGPAELERTGIQDVVVLSRQAGADCGSATLAILGAAKKTSKIETRAQVVNPCDLQGEIVRNGDLQAVRLSGPYYAHGAPLCCPTKPHASATIRFRNGTWDISPAIFPVTSPRHIQ
jgi:hypothetical protein